MTCLELCLSRQAHVPVTFQLVEMLQMWLCPHLLSSDLLFTEEELPDIQEVTPSNSVLAPLAGWKSLASEISVVISCPLKSI